MAPRRRCVPHALGVTAPPLFVRERTDGEPLEQKCARFSHLEIGVVAFGYADPHGVDLERLRETISVAVGDDQTMIGEADVARLRRARVEDAQANRVADLYGELWRPWIGAPLIQYAR